MDFLKILIVGNYFNIFTYIKNFILNKIIQIYKQNYSVKLLILNIYNEKIFKKLFKFINVIPNIKIIIYLYYIFIIFEILFINLILNLLFVRFVLFILLKI